MLHGRPYLPSLPPRLWNLVAPGVGEKNKPESKDRWAQFCRDIEERVRDQQLCRVLVTNSAEFRGGESYPTTAGPPLRVVGSW